MKYRIVTNGKKYRVQVKKFLFWTFFTYGVNEGGGDGFIEENSPFDCWKKLAEVMEDRDIWRPVED